MTGGLLPDDIETLARRVVEENAALGRKVTVAESCTGGLVAAALTEIPGSSAVLDRGFVTYSNEAKMECLDVSLEIIETFGAVSIACAWAMAKGALDRSHADVAVAISGVAAEMASNPKANSNGSSRLRAPTFAARRRSARLNSCCPRGWRRRFRGRTVRPHDLRTPAPFCGRHGRNTGLPMLRRPRCGK